MAKEKVTLNARVTEALGDSNVYRVVMLVGDGVYNGTHYPADEIERASPTMKARPLNLDHSEKLEDIVGVVTEAAWDGKALAGAFKLDPKRPKYELAKAHVDGTLEAGGIPNVSVEVYLSRTEEEHNGETRLVARNLEFSALALVSVGACDDSDGCGVQRSHFSKEEPNMEGKEEAKLCKGDGSGAALTALRKDHESLAAEYAKLQNQVTELEKERDAAIQERDALRDEAERAPVVAEIAKLAKDFNAEGKSLDTLRAVLDALKATHTATDDENAGRKSALADAPTDDEKAALAERLRTGMGLKPKSA